MKRTLRVAWVLLTLWAAAASSAAELVLYVAPNGRDAWTGRLANPNADASDGPLASPAGARDRLRALRAAGEKLPTVRVVIADGRYRLTEPLTLTPADSGSAEAPVIWEAAPGTKPILTGGREIVGWREVPDPNADPQASADAKLWVAEVPELRDASRYFRQLWVNGRRAVRARTPNELAIGKMLRIESLPDLKPTDKYNVGQGRFVYRPGDLRAFANLTDVQVMVLHFWVGTRLTLAELDERTRLVTLATKSRRNLTEAHSHAKLAPYWVENAAELLDAPGEWYLDRSARTVRYKPRPGETLATATVTAATPGLATLLRLVGEPEQQRWVEHIHFRGLGLQFAEWFPAANDAADGQAEPRAESAVHAVGARRCRWEGCTVAHVGGYGVHLGAGCTENVLTGCELRDLGAGGVKIGETRLPTKPELRVGGNTVSDCTLIDGGHIVPQAVGVLILQADGNVIAHNEIADFYYTGISVGWTWGYGPSAAGGNRLERNLIRDIGKGLLSDMSGVYTLGAQPGTVVRGNVIRDVSANNYGGWGIYFDEGSAGIVAEDNLVVRTTHGGFHQHYGRDNVVRNNVFAFGRDYQIRRSRAEPHRSFAFEGNIVLWSTGKLGDGRWEDTEADRFAVDRNLYWRLGGDGTAGLAFGKSDWAAWQSRGFDRSSLVADPKFADPTAGDFRLADDSPASKIGFRRVDWSQVGPRRPKP